MEWVEDVFYGAVAKGVNVRSSSPLKVSRLPDAYVRVVLTWFCCSQDTTVGVFRAACLACIASLAVLLYICWNNYPELITHCVFALTLSIFLYAIMYW